MRTSLGSLVLSSPVLVAAGCAGTGRELAQLIPLAHLGGLVTPSAVLHADAGSVSPQLAETPSGLLTARVPGPTLAGLLGDDLPWLARQRATVIVSLGGQSVDEFELLAQQLRGVAGVSGLELNLAGPDLDAQGTPFEESPLRASAVTARVRRVTPSHVPVLARLSAHIADLVEVARACMTAGADALSLSGSIPGMLLDAQTLRPVPVHSGWLSGPAIRPVGLRAVYRVRAALPALPILAAGGVMTGPDALQYLAAGANAVCVGTGALRDPLAPITVHNALAASLAERRLPSARDIMGCAHAPIPAR
ncbi:MAG: tRNA-dihydrouridine synthase [Actinomycetales bacterium]|nr:tRNA-dihydrouridine synthase [Actinomycetales bacterium]